MQSGTRCLKPGRRYAHSHAGCCYPVWCGLQAENPLAQFLDYCTYGHMIDNVVLIVTGTLHERDVQVSVFFLLPLLGLLSGNPAPAARTTLAYHMVCGGAKCSISSTGCAWRAA